MEQQVLDIIWFVIWGLVVLAGIGVVLFVAVFVVSLLGFRNETKKITRGFERKSR
ncbi:hypothetical protein [Herbiconiux solani]|uniref:hypothetical protein n=1 Tax=Herbiconiux solani TaxID=661329 RepID=UPI0012ED5436|nr:hypothetical protein [Herbiconiux solani]